MYYVMTWKGLMPPVVLWYGESEAQGLEMLKVYGPGHMLFKVVAGS